MAGGAPPKLPLGLDQWIYAAPYGIVVFLELLSTVGTLYDPYPWHVWYLSAFALLCAFLGKRTGHGGGIDLGRWNKDRDPERLEFIIIRLRGRIPEYWYDVLLLSLTGLAVTLVPGILVAFVNPWGVAIALSGILKGPSYMVGWKIYPKGKGWGIPHLNEATAIGEFLTGLTGWGFLFL